MKTYFIDKIENKSVNFTANSIAELEHIAIKNANYIQRIYVHCSHVSDGKTDEQNVEYCVRVNNQKRIISTKRV